MSFHPNLSQVLDELFVSNALQKGTLSSPKKKKEGLPEKIWLRPILLKGKPSVQATEQHGPQVVHRNFTLQQALEYTQQQLGQYKQAFFQTTQREYQILSNRSDNLTILCKEISSGKKPLSLTHNISKQYLLREGEPIPFLVHLGVMNAEGRVYPKKMAKFRQINRFLELIADALPHLPQGRTLQIVDFGCGKAYLTFALYHFLHVQNGFDIQVTGLDLKKDVVEFCQAMACEMGYQALAFMQGDIESHVPQGKVDMVVALHACDIATDAALEKGVRWEADVILAVPCCQHELYDQIQNVNLTPLLKHGILRERFAALATDAARAQVLEILGYKTQILEFVDMEHTPKNLLIRAYRKPGKSKSQVKAEYLAFKKAMQIEPSIESRFTQELNF